MNLSGQLATLEAWGLIHPVVAGAQVEYRFRHALVHDAAYVTLLKQQRRELHEAVGEVLDDALALGDGRDSEEMAPILAFHFNEAGNQARASHYFAIAGAAAARKYAPREAAAYYSQAIQAAPAPQAELFQSRGRVFELQFNFDAARRDFERAAELAHAAGDMPAEWQALLSLGLLWAGRDYNRSGDYCRLAFELAQKTGQPALVARSYNRLGNWNLNVEQPLEAARCHDQALSIFQFLHDDAGIAETLDLLGMASILSGDMPRGARYYQEAIALNQRLGNRQALANVLGSQLLTAEGGYQTLVLYPSPLVQSDLTAQGEQAIRMTHEIGWRDGEAFVNMTLSIYGQGRGDYALALRTGHAGLDIATEISHEQWIAGHLYSLGLAHFDFLDWAGATQYLEKGLALSRSIGSLHWTRCHIGMLTVVHIEAGDLDRAAAVLATAGEIRQPPQSLGERLITYARAQMGLARGELDAALEQANLLLAAAGASAPDASRAIPLLGLLLANIYTARGDYGLAERECRRSAEAATEYNERPLEWRLRRSLGRALTRLGRQAEAAQVLEQARTLVDKLAAGLPEAGLRDTFRLHSGLFG